MDWQGIWNTIKNFFVSNAWDILLFFAVFLLGLILIKIIMKMLDKILSKTRMEKIAQHFLLAIIKFIFYFIWVLALLSIIGINISGIITAFSALVLAIGMALQNLIANLANGIVIVSSHMFKKGDYIIVGGQEGSITEINFLFTTIMTVDNKKITIPNSTIVNSSVVNAGANDRRRVDFTFSVAYETDCEKVKKIVTDVMASDGRVYLDPAPFCKLKTLGASSIDFFANCWCDTEDYWNVYYYVMENVYNEFKRNDISIPYNQLEVRNRTDKVVMPYQKAKLPARVEKVREEHHEHGLFSLGAEHSKLDKKEKKEAAKHEKEEAKKAKEDAKKASKEKPKTASKKSK